MTPLPENNTPTLFIRYSSRGQMHDAQVRLPSGATSASATIAAGVMIAVMKPLLFPSDVIYGARFRQAGSDVSLPLPISAQAGMAPGTPDDDRMPNFVSWTGRSADGRDVKFTLFTAAVSLDQQGWRDLTPSAGEQAVLLALTDDDVDARTISGQQPVWNAYVNYGASAYYQRKARRTVLPTP